MPWSVADIDVAIPIARAKRDEAVRRGDLVAAADHQGWIDILLDARPGHVRDELVRSSAAASPHRGKKGTASHHG